MNQCSHHEGCKEPSVYNTFGIHYCRDHFDAIRANGRDHFDQAEDTHHGSMIYVERQLFMDVTRQLYEKLKLCDATEDDLIAQIDILEERIGKVSKVRDTLWNVACLVLVMIPLAIAIHVMW